MLSTALYNDQANLREAGDSAAARAGGTVLRTRLADNLRGRLRDPRVTDSLERTPDMRALGAGVACNVKVACALAVARAQEARWVVMSKVSKTSNLIWLLSAQLIRVEDGSIVLDDSTELKGEPGSGWFGWGCASSPTGCGAPCRPAASRPTSRTASRDHPDFERRLAGSPVPLHLRARLQGAGMTMTRREFAGAVTGLAGAATLGWNPSPSPAPIRAALPSAIQALSPEPTASRPSPTRSAVPGSPGRSG